MFNKDKSQKRLLVLGLLIVTLIFVYVFQTWLLPTLTRYIYREQDEIRAHYTALYFASTGEGKTIALENDEGFVEFDLRNYIGEKVTQRDIVYTISKPSVFYDDSGNAIADVKSYLEESSDNELHVLDVWGKPKKVEKSTYLYDVEIVKNNGEVYSEGVYAFSYEKLGSSAVGKVHNVTCKVSRNSQEIPTVNYLETGEEPTISLVVQLSQPYKEVLIINMKISELLITFSHKEIDMFNVMFDKVYIQTADLFAYNKSTNTQRTQAIAGGKNYYQFNSYAFKVTITWSGYVLDEDKLEDIHIGTAPYPGGDRQDDVMDPNGIINNGGTTPNPDSDKPYLDVEKSTIAKINSLYDDANGHSGELVIFVPQSSDIYLLFLKTANSGRIDVKVETYISYYHYNESLGTGECTNSAYKLYNDVFFGAYVHDIDDTKFNLAEYTK